MCRAFFEPEDILQDKRNKMHEAEDAYDLLNGRVEVALEDYEDYVAYLERTNNADNEDDPRLEELLCLWREATSEAEAAQSRINAATQAYEDYRNEMYGILGT
jgi:DNA repair ATPase RecN